MTPQVAHRARAPDPGGIRGHPDGKIRSGSAAAVAETTTAVVAFERGHGFPRDLLYPLDDELGDAIAAVHLVRRLGIGVEQNDLDLASIRGVDQSRRVRNRQTV